MRETALLVKDTSLIDEVIRKEVGLKISPTLEGNDVFGYDPNVPKDSVVLPEIKRVPLTEKDLERYKSWHSSSETTTSKPNSEERGMLGWTFGSPKKLRSSLLN